MQQVDPVTFFFADEPDRPVRGWLCQCAACGALERRVDACTREDMPPELRVVR